MFLLLSLTGASVEERLSLFGNAFGSPEPSLGSDPLTNTCSPSIARFDENDPNLSTAAKESLLGGILIANDKSKGSGWLISMKSKKSLRYDLPYPGGNHESAVSPDGNHIAVGNYEIPTFNSTEGGGASGHAVSIVDIHTGRAAVLPMHPLLDSFAVAPKPHDSDFLPNGDLLISGQLDNAVARVDAKTGNVTAYLLGKTGCITPHLVRVIPMKGEKPRFVVTGCRGTNAGTPGDYVGHLAVIDLVTEDVRALETPGGKWDEGITVTNEGEIWVGTLNKGFVTVFGWKKDSPKTLESLTQLSKMELAYPLRFAYDEVTDRVAVATLNLDAVLKGDSSDSGLHVFNAKTKELIKSIQLSTKRGVINSEGLRDGPGFFYTGGFDTQAGVIVDAQNVEQVAEILFPRCSLPIGQCKPLEYLPNGPSSAGRTIADDAKARGLSGWNNWSGGLCEATERSPFDRRFTVLDGFNYSPVLPRWAQ